MQTKTLGLMLMTLSLSFASLAHAQSQRTCAGDELFCSEFDTEAGAWRQDSEPSAPTAGAPCYDFGDYGVVCGYNCDYFPKYGVHCANSPYSHCKAIPPHGVVCGA